jgi:parallel beta-helix repeat protein
MWTVKPLQIWLLMGLVLACWFEAPCHARTVEVSNVPELVAACQKAEPYDTLVLAAGTYTITNRSRILITNCPGPIVVKGATGNPADVIIEGKGQDDASVQMIFDLDNSPRWSFEGFTTRGTYYHGFKFNGSSTDCTLRNISMRDHGESGVKGTSTPQATTHPDRLLIEGCDIGFSPGGGGTRSVVEGVDGVGVKRWVVRQNRFVNILRPDGGVAFAVFTKGNSSDTLIENNRFENCFIGASLGGGGTGKPFFRDNDQIYEHRGGIIRNNVFIRCQDAAIYINKGQNCKIYNNTLFECGLTIQVRFSESSAWVRNNLLKPAQCSGDEPAVRIREGAILLANETNILAGESDFAVARGSDTQIDLHLRLGSAAIDAGVNVGTDVPGDMDGQARSRGGRCDIGADEWSAAVH